MLRSEGLPEQYAALSDMVCDCGNVLPAFTECDGGLVSDASDLDDGALDEL
jgi:hypothetical protein